MLLLCVTGLPLIFHEEIDEFLHEEVAAASVPAGTPKADLDQAMASALAQFPGQVPHFLVWDTDHHPNALLVSIGKTLDSDPSKNLFARVDAHTGAFLDAPEFTG